MKDYFLIKGGGPAGLSASIYLLKNGYKCKLIEKKTYPEKMANRGFQVLENYTKKEDSLNLFEQLDVKDFFYFPINKAVFWDLKYNFYNFFSKENFGYLIRRGYEEGSIDMALLKKTKELGIEIINEDLKPDIISTGPCQPDGIGQERHFKTDDSLRIWVLMDSKKIPGGYAYLFTFNGKGTFGCAITYNFKKIKEISNFCFRFFQKIEDFKVEDLKIYHSYINFYIPETYEKDGILYAGEAGGMQDFFLGLGIRIAMESGIIAARSLIENFSYSDKIKELFYENFKRTFVLRIFYEKFPDFIFKFLLKKYVKKDGKKILYKLTNLAYPLKIFPIFKILCKNKGICAHKINPHFCRKMKRI